jgi:uncharacterized protein YndB with AHSA1/START domain
MAEVRLEVELAHPRDRVWRALTDARLLSEWLMPTDLAAAEGARFTLEAGTLAGFLGPVSGELTELAPPEKMVMLWRGEKLHTRVVWELTESDHGCTLQLVQTGFIGAPAALRRRALRDTYTRLFAEQLPAVLDRLAAGTAAGAGAVDVAAPTAGAPPDPVVPPPRRGRDPEPAAGAGEPARRGWRAGLDRLGSAPAWVRTVAIGAAAAALAVAVFAAIAYTPRSGVGGGGPGTGPDAERDAPGVALQPGGGTSQASPVESTGPAAAGWPGESPGSSSAPAQGGAGVPGSTPGGGSEGTAAASPPAPAPVLIAELTTSDTLLLGLGGRAVTVTVSNPGPGSAPDWEVAMDVGGREVTNVSGAGYQRDGAQALFTPVDAELAAGTSTEFSFELPGLLGAGDPTGCTINGNPCG